MRYIVKPNWVNEILDNIAKDAPKSWPALIRSPEERVSEQAIDRAAYESDKRHDIEEKLPLLEAIHTWLLKEDRLRLKYKGGIVTAIHVCRWAQANKVSDQVFAETLIKQLVTDIDLLGEKLLAIICNAPPPDILVPPCDNCDRSPMKHKE